MILRFPLLALAGLTLATAALSQGAPSTPPTLAPAADLRPDPAIRFGVLPNGMHYAIRRNATPARNASLRLRIGAGSLHESDAQRGLAHFLEHMVLNGTTHVPEGDFERRLARLGLRMGDDTNAATGWRQTVFRLDLPENDAATVNEALLLLRELAGEATLAQSAIDSERRVIQAEVGQRVTGAYRLGTEELGWMLEGQRLPRRTPEGLPEIIAAAGHAELAAFYDAYYRPERATLIAVGDFDVDRMEAAIRTRFSDWRGRGPAGPDPEPDRVAGREESRFRLTVNRAAPERVTLTWTYPPDLAPDTVIRRTADLADRLALLILNRRLQRLGNDTPPPFLSANANRNQIGDSARLVQVGAVARPGEWQSALTTIEREQRRLAEHGVTSVELRRALTEMRAQLEAAVASARTFSSPMLADMIVAAVDGNRLVTAPAEDLALFDAAAPVLTPARVSEAARALLAGPPLVYQIVRAMPEGGPEAIRTAFREARSAPVAPPDTATVQAWPYADFGRPGRVTERRELPEPIGATLVRFANGVRLTVKHNAATQGRVAVAVDFGRGRLDLPMDRPNPYFGLAAGFVGGGLGRLGYDDMQDSLGGHLYGAALATLEDRFRLSGDTRPADLGVQLQVLAAYLTDPGWRDSAWNRLRSLGASMQVQLATSPNGIFAREGDSLLRDGDRRWSTPDREEMAAMPIAALRAVLDGPLARAPLQVLIVGDVDVEEAIRQTAATFGALPPRPAASDRPAVPAHFARPATEPVRLTHQGNSDRGLALIAWPTQGFFQDQRQARALNLLAAIYRQRLIDLVREAQGTAYSPVAYQYSSEAFPFGLFAARIEAPATTLAGFLRDAQSIADALRERPVDADEMRRARLPQVEAIVRARTGNGWWIDGLARVQTDPRAIAMLASQLEDYRSITADEVQRAARAFLLPERAWSMIVAPQPRATAPAAAPAH